MIRPFDEADTLVSYLLRSKLYTREEHDAAAREVREMLREYRDRILSDVRAELRSIGTSQTP